MEKLIGLLGIALILGLTVLLSNNRRHINWRLVLTGIVIQVVFAFLILKVPFVRGIFDSLGNGVQSLLDSAKEGVAFVAGEELAKSKFIFALVIGGSIIFVGALTNLLYHFGILQKVVQGLGWALRKSMRISGAEALSAGAEVFLGQVESQLLISRYIKTVTQSELLGIMACAMATISGSALVAYVSLGIDPTYLLMASFMTAPSALVIAKIMIPETDMSALEREVELADDRQSVNFIDALADGARQGWDVVVNV
ncbi:MAG TPA: Na+ dependent nucleoside transporter N-terminal domain-containing protein, partial [Candidatus Melainabacteria bacterium]|nr:Na+ dependent nucleoside transporter N-terminal domain-containing protein [Candidatus Melainabacteria bacterium]